MKGKRITELKHCYLAPRVFGWGLLAFEDNVYGERVMAGYLVHIHGVIIRNRFSF